MPALRIVTAISVCLTSLSVLACESPESLEILIDSQQEPNRLTSQVDMLRYANEMADYVSCIRDEIESLRESRDESPELARLTQIHNVAVAELETARDRYVANVGPIEELASLEPMTCIETRRGASPEVIDARNILFFAQDGLVYRNVLPRECGGLSPLAVNLRFSDTVLGGRAPARNRTRVARCEGSRFAVVQQQAGMATNTCRLGRFFLISPDEADQLLAR